MRGLGLRHDLECEQVLDHKFLGTQKFQASRARRDVCVFLLGYIVVLHPITFYV